MSKPERRQPKVIQELLPRHGEKGIQQNGSIFKDPAFADNKSLPVHRWVPWIAGFSAAFVDDVLAFYLGRDRRRKRALVLDPFAGVGTTLVEAAWHGYDYLGFEINPYAVLAARAKLRASELRLDGLDKAIGQMRRQASAWQTSPAPAAVRPPHFRSRIPFFSPRIEQQVLHALAFMGRLEPPEVADLFRVAFGAVMVSFSNYTYEPSLGSRPGAGKPLIEDADVAAVLLGKLQQMRADIVHVQDQTPSTPRIGRGSVHNVDFFTGQKQIASGTVHLTVTSPPYLNNYHYVRNTRPQLYWLSLVTSPKDQRHLEENNFGKFWQTMRDAEPVPLTFEHDHLHGLLAQLRQVRVEAGAYGGPGWANYAAAYFNDCNRFLAALSRLLASGGVGLIVIGNSIIQGIELKVDEILGDLAGRHGLRLEGIQCNREKRVGASITQSSVRRGDINRSVLYESTVVLRRP